MHNEFTAIIERDGDWFVAYSPEVAGANGQGRTRDEALASLADAIALILDERLRRDYTAGRAALFEGIVLDELIEEARRLRSETGI